MGDENNKKTTLALSEEARVFMGTIVAIAAVCIFHDVMEHGYSLSFAGEKLNCSLAPVNRNVALI